MDIIHHRRALHRIPELDRELPKTTAYLQSVLKELNCQVFSPVAGSVCAFFDFGKQDSIAFRADADALPISEATGAAYASTHPGRMHACGHDGHMAILLELARRLHGKTTMLHNVLLVFQPAEETTGGAKIICDTGLFTTYRTKAIFGLHLWPGLTKGTIFSREQEMMSRSCEVTVDIFGKSAHIAKGQEGIDALAAAVEFYTKTRAMEKNLPDSIFRLLNFGWFESGSVRNAISAHTHMEGSLRAFQDEVFYALKDGMAAIATEVESTTGCTIQIHTGDGYPAILNPPELARKVRSCVDFQPLDTPSMTTEDFSWYQRYLPGMFFFLGLGDTPPLHAADFDFDESILVKGADFFEKLAENFL